MLIVLFFAGLSFVLFYVIRGVWFVFTQRAAKGLKCLAIGLLPPVAFVIFATLLFPSCAENDPWLSEWVTLKGRVVNANGHPVEGVNITLRTYFTERGDYSGGQARENVTDSSGTYELTEVYPLSLEMTAGYLVRSNAAVRCVPFFFGEIYATRPSVGEWEETPQLTLPVISENRLKRARRSIRFLGWPDRKENDVWLPRSEGDVIFLPDIIVGDDPSIEENKRSREEALKDMRKTAVRFGPNGYWNDKGTYRPFP